MNKMREGVEGQSDTKDYLRKKFKVRYLNEV